MTRLRLQSSATVLKPNNQLIQTPDARLPLTDSKDNLQALVDKAERTVDLKSVAHTSVKRSLSSVIFSRRGLIILTWLCCFVMAIQYGNAIRTMLFGVGQAIAEHEATEALRAARNAVEDYKKATGELPDRIPSAALAAVVNFERTDTGYVLITWIDGQKTVMDEKEAISRSRE